MSDSRWMTPICYATNSARCKNYICVYVCMYMRACVRACVHQNQFIYINFSVGLYIES